MNVLRNQILKLRFEKEAWKRSSLHRKGQIEKLKSKSRDAKIDFYKKLEKKLKKIVDAEMDVVDYYYEVSEKLENLRNE